MREWLKGEFDAYALTCSLALLRAIPQSVPISREWALGLDELSSSPGLVSSARIWRCPVEAAEVLEQALAAGLSQKQMDWPVLKPREQGSSEEASRQVRLLADDRWVLASAQMAAGPRESRGKSEEATYSRLARQKRHRLIRSGHSECCQRPLSSGEAS